MNRVLKYRLKLVNQAPTANSRELLNSAVNRVGRDFEILNQDIHLLMEAQQRSALQDQRELEEVLNMLKHAQNRTMPRPQLINENHLQEFEGRATRRDWVILGIAIGVTILLSLLLRFF